MDRTTMIVAAIVSVALIAVTALGVRCDGKYKEECGKVLVECVKKHSALECKGICK